MTTEHTKSDCAVADEDVPSHVDYQDLAHAARAFFAACRARKVDMLGLEAALLADRALVASRAAQAAPSEEALAVMEEGHALVGARARSFLRPDEKDALTASAADRTHEEGDHAL
jgi:hypothetical protein